MRTAIKLIKQGDHDGAVEVLERSLRGDYGLGGMKKAAESIEKTVSEFAEVLITPSVDIVEGALVVDEEMLFDFDQEVRERVRRTAYEFAGRDEGLIIDKVRAVLIRGLEEGKVRRR
jgi:hypothetical protein